MTYIDQNIDLQHGRPTFIASKFPPKLTFTFLSVCGTLRPLTCQLLLNKNLFQNPSNQTPYILKARILTTTIPQKNLNFPQICPKMPQNGPKMAKNDPKWPKVAEI